MNNVTVKPLTRAELCDMFKKEVCDLAKKIDPDQEQDWFSLSLGWAIAKGLSPKRAHTFSIHVRYRLHYFDCFGT